MKFESKFDVGDLVEHSTNKTTGVPVFGFIRCVSFERNDAVNFICRYRIDRVNSEEIDQSVNESEIRRAFHPEAEK